jgi:hypothetical protein
VSAAVAQAFKPVEPRFISAFLAALLLVPCFEFVVLQILRAVVEGIHYRGLNRIGDLGRRMQLWGGQFCQGNFAKAILPAAAFQAAFWGVSRAFVPKRAG